jgi:periplasmic divalent cation tolerance protein
MRNQPDDILIVMVTAANSDEAARISEAVVNAHLAACATVVPAVTSVYWWEGKLTKDQESLVVMKTARSRYSQLENAIRQVHSYKVPEILAVQVAEGSLEYMRWVLKETAEGGREERL